MNTWQPLVIIIFIAASCQTKKSNADPEQFFPVQQYLEGQVAEMDSTMQTIIMVESINNGSPDTTYLPRTQFKKAAQPFLELPDISAEKLRDDYEVISGYDDLLNAFVFTYTTTEEKHPIKKQDVIVQPGDDGANEIKIINIDSWKEEKGATVHRNMVWESNKKFLIITKSSTGHAPDQIHKLEVIWNNFPGGTIHR